MPQVHLVAYCGDLGYGVAHGAEMLSLMMFLGIISRIGSGFVADAIGGSATLLIGSFMQGVALLLYLYFDGLTSLFVVSGIFGLFQGGIVPMYAVICRELLPPRQAGAAIGLVVSATIFGMAFGGYFSGLIFDLTSSYRMAFLNGLLFNVFNFAIVGLAFLAPPAARAGGAATGGLSAAARNDRGFEKIVGEDPAGRRLLLQFAVPIEIVHPALVQIVGRERRPFWCRSARSAGRAWSPATCARPRAACRLSSGCSRSRPRPRSPTS